MSDYIIPSEGDFDEVVDVVKKAGMQLMNPSSVREFIIETADEGTTISAIGNKELLVLNKNSSALLDEMPTVVMSVPGVIYSGDWVALATAFPAIDWTELESKLAKSGHLATSPEQLEKRDTGIFKDDADNHSQQTEEMSRRRPRLTGGSSEEEDSDPDMTVD